MLKYLLSISLVRTLFWVLCGTHVLAYVLGRSLASRRSGPAVHYHYDREAGDRPRGRRGRSADDRVGSFLRFLLLAFLSLVLYAYWAEICDFVGQSTSTSFFKEIR